MLPADLNPSCRPRRQRSVGGELRRDPVCGTFVPANSSFQKSLNGQSYCSARPNAGTSMPDDELHRQFTRALRIVWIIVGFVSGFLRRLPLS